MDTPRRRMGQQLKRKEPPAACPFCEEQVPRPRILTDEVGPDACRGARCKCGALYIVDITGKEGGQAVLDALTVAAGGDMDRGLAMRGGTDYELKGVGYNPRTHSLDLKHRRRFGQPKLWFIRLLGEAGAAGS